MTIKEIRLNIKKVINILSRNQKDIKYILKKYKNQELLSLFDVLNNNNKEVLRALFYIYKNVEKSKKESIYIPTKYIFNDILYNFVNNDNIETFFYNLQKYYLFKIYLSESLIMLRYDEKSNYIDLKHLAYVMNLLLKKYPLRKDYTRPGQEIDIKKSEKKYKIQYLREDKINRLMKNL